MFLILNVLNNSLEAVGFLTNLSVDYVDYVYLILTFF